MENKTNKKTWFERAIFLSWYCAGGDCAFCYMSTQKKRIKNPKLAKRRKESVLAEALICKVCGWEIEFLSGGYESYSIDELLGLVRQIHKVTGKKQWLNIGVLNEKEIKSFLPHIKGICGAVECVDPGLHKKLCPSKPIEPIVEMFRLCEKHRLKKAMTIIIGLGESIDDFRLLKQFVKKNKINRITLYRLNPHPGTPFRQGPDTGYYAQWIAQTRSAFPGLEIIAGSWVDKVSEISELLNAGADAITKFPSIKLFNSRFAREIKKQAQNAGRRFMGTLTKLPKIDWDKEVDKLALNNELKQKIKIKLRQYLRLMSKKK